MLNTFSFIFTTVILPIFFQICLGFFVQKKLKFNLKTLSQIQFYVLVPALLFVKIYQSNLAGELVSKIMLSTVSVYIGLVIIGFITAWAFRFKKSMRNAFSNSVSMYNSGNYCIPLMQLLYNNDPYIMSVQAVVMTTQNVIVSSIGALMASSGASPIKQSLKGLLKIPMLYVAATAALCKIFSITVWEPVVSTADIISSGLVPVALFTLGAQLSEIKMDFSDYRIYVSNAIKLLAGPLVALATVSLFGISGMAAQVVMIVSAAPTAVNVLILAMQYDNEVDFTSKAVFSSTVFSSVTVTVVIYIAQMLFK